MSLENIIIDYTENEADIRHWVLLKGEFRYNMVIDFLINNNIPCTWKNITNYVRYDKRILINSFKYIVFLEEFYKSFVCNRKNYSYSKVRDFGFRRILDEYLALNCDKTYDGINVNALQNNKEKIINFRNAVSHNKILLCENYGDDNNKMTLQDILRLFVLILPKSYRDGFKKDINNSKLYLVEDFWHVSL